jgi:uncharacterized protein (DUF2141 family)
MKAVAISLAATVAALLTAGAAQAGDVTVTLTGVQARGGQVLVALQSRDQFMQAGGFSHRIEAPAAGTVTITFSDVPAGDYALSAFHDENADSQMQSSAIGIPVEGWAMSNGDALMGPPTFDLVRVSIPADGGAITEAMHYWDGQIPGQ